jgi:ZIP family zinc transporter
LLDGIPESVVLGLSLLGGRGVSPAVLAGIVISNVPEGLSSAAGMKRAGRSAGYVFGVWGAIAGASSVLGYVALDGVSPALIALITAVAAGAILAMLADTMVPEAFEQAHVLTGLITALGFLTALAVHLAGS